MPSFWIPLQKGLQRRKKGPSPEKLGTGKVTKSGPFTDENTEDQGYITGTWQSWDANSAPQDPNPGDFTPLPLTPRARLGLCV